MPAARRPHRFAPRLTPLEARETPSATLVSVGLAGTEAGNARSQIVADATQTTRDASRAVSADGRFVVFQSFATDLVGAATSGGVVYVRDRTAGTTSAVSVGIDGKGYGAGDASISADGRYVVFEAGPQTGTTAFVPGFEGGPGAGGQLYIRDLQANTTALVSVRPDGKGGIGAGSGYSASVSDDGRFVAFRYVSDDLAAGDANGTNDIFVRDTVAGTTALVSRTPAGGVGNGNSADGVISGNGKTVVFRSLATDLTATPDANAAFDLFAYSVADAKVSAVSVNLPGTATGDKGVAPQYRLDGTGTKVVFVSPSTDLTAVPGVADAQVFARDLTAGTTAILSLRPDGKPLAGTVLQPAISADGRFAAFATNASLSPDPSPNTTQVYLVELATGRLALASRTPGGSGSVGTSALPAVSGDGRYVVFESNGPDLVPGVALGANGGGSKRTLFAYDRLANRTVPISTTAANSQTLSTGVSTGNTRFAVSRDGSAVAFTSDQTEYGPSDANGALDVYAAAIPVLQPLAPAGTVNQSAGQSDPAAVAPVRFTVAFNQPVFGFDAADVDLSASTAGGPLVAAVTGGGQTYTVSVTGMTAAGDVVVRVPAGAAVTIDGTATPVVTLLDNAVTAFPEVTLTGSSVAEFRPAGTAVGTLAGLPAAGHTYTFALVAGTGAGDNAAFTIGGNQLLSTGVFDFAAKPTYSIRVRATDEQNRSFDQVLTVAVTDDPSVARVGRTLQVVGTAGDDSFAFAAGATTHDLVLNGVNLAAPAADVDTVVFHGGGGKDAAVLYGRGKDNVAGLGPNYGVLKGTGFEVWVDGTLQIGAVAGGPGGVAYLAGTAGDETFAGTPTYATLAGAGFANTAGGFGSVVAYANGGQDVAYLAGTAGDETFVGTPTYAILTGAGFYNQAEGFRFVVAYSNGGNDVAYLADSAGDDTFVATPSDATMAGATFFNGVVGFKNVAAYATNGGSDAAFLADSSGNDNLVASGSVAELTSAVHYVRVEGFDGVRAFGTNGGVNKKHVGIVNFFLDASGMWVG